MVYLTVVKLCKKKLIVEKILNTEHLMHIPLHYWDQTERTQQPGQHTNCYGDWP